MGRRRAKLMRQFAGTLHRAAKEDIAANTKLECLLDQAPFVREPRTDPPSQRRKDQPGERFMAA